MSTVTGQPFLSLGRVSFFSVKHFLNAPLSPKSWTTLPPLCPGKILHSGIRVPLIFKILVFLAMPYSLWELFLKFLFNLLIFGCTVSLLLCAGFL